MAMWNAPGCEPSANPRTQYPHPAPSDRFPTNHCFSLRVDVLNSPRALIDLSEDGLMGPDHLGFFRPAGRIVTAGLLDGPFHQSTQAVVAQISLLSATNRAPQDDKVTLGAWPAR
jgi:hypothetical protein